MAVGSLRDQIIYPDNHAEQLKKQIKDEELQDILSKVNVLFEFSEISQYLIYLSIILYL